MEVWPSTLPLPEQEGYNEVQANNILRTAMDAGAPKQRRRYTAVYTTVKFQMTLTSTQTTTLMSFYNLVGAAAFTWTHPRTGTPVTARFTEPPILSAKDNHILAGVTLEVL
mgnify:CR=1 FL=1